MSFFQAFRRRRRSFSCRLPWPSCWCCSDGPDQDRQGGSGRAANDDRRRRLRVFLYTWLWNNEEAKKRKARERVKMFPPKEGSTLKRTTIKSVFSSKRHFLSPPHAHGRGPNAKQRLMEDARNVFFVRMQGSCNCAYYYSLCV